MPTHCSSTETNATPQPRGSSYGCSPDSRVRTQPSLISSKQFTSSRPGTGWSQAAPGPNRGRSLLHVFLLPKSKKRASQRSRTADPRSSYLFAAIGSAWYRDIRKTAHINHFCRLSTDDESAWYRLVPSGAAPVGISVRGTAPAVMACPRRRSLGYVVFQFGDVALGKLPNRSPSQRELQPLEFALS